MRTLVRYNPARELTTLQREFDRLFNGFVQNDSDDNAVWMPRVDLAESDDRYTLALDLPGLSKEDLDINYHDGVLTISGERKAEETEEQRNFVRVERRFGQFRRSFTLPKVDAENIKATYADGVLTIDVPKVEEVKPRKIAVL